MHARVDPPDEVLSTAASQGGVVSAAQITSLGYNLRSAERLVSQRSWQRLDRGLYQLGVGDVGWEGLAWGGVLLGGADARLGFEAAGHLWGIIEEQPRAITVLVPHGSLLTTRARWVFRQERSGVRSQRSPGAPPRTTVEDTVIDLCDLGSTREVPGLVSKAVQSDRTTADRLRESVESRPRMRHRRLLTEMLAGVAAGAESALELRYLHEVERPHDLPRARRQARSSAGAIRDMVYDEFATIIELDGRLHIAGRFRDMQRDNSALLGGRVTLRYGWPDVTERPCEVAWQVGAVLAARGWAGLPSRCDRCLDAADADLLGA